MDRHRSIAAEVQIESVERIPSKNGVKAGVKVIFNDVRAIDRELIWAVIIMANAIEHQIANVKRLNPLDTARNRMLNRSGGRNSKQ